MNDKIKISLDDVNSSQVDESIKRQDMLHRMQQHQQTVARNTQSSQLIQPGKGGFFRKTMIYMTFFGLVSSIIAWGCGEYIQNCEDKNDFFRFQEVVRAILYLENKNPDVDISLVLEKIKEEPRYINNPYLDNNLSKDQMEEMRKIDESKLKFYNTLWYILVATCIAIGLSIAESVVSCNWIKTLQNLSIAIVLGAFGAWLVSLFLDKIYNFLQGDNPEDFFLRQVFARAVGWGLFGLFVSITPGILMRSWKKLLLGLLGGLVGGLIGGVLFDVVAEATHSAILPRFIGIIGFGTLAGVATAFLENVAKQGWLKIKAGLIAGKQFIIYKNPTTIGSSPKCDVYLFKDTSIAGIHAAIHLLNGNYVLCSQVGALTYVNNQPVQECTLNNGDMIQIGQTLIQFEAKKIQNN